MAMEIDMKELSVTAEISIRTRHHEYLFCITDPSMCTGLMTGGVFGEQKRAVIFSGAVSEDRQRYVSTTLRVGNCALFYVTDREHLHRLTTSVITNLEIKEVRADNPSAPDC